MGNKEKVIQKYPHACASDVKPKLQLGQSAPYQKGVWYILRRKELGATVLGEGKSEELAWQNAANNL